MFYMQIYNIQTRSSTKAKVCLSLRPVWFRGSVNVKGFYVGPSTAAEGESQLQRFEAEVALQNESSRSKWACRRKRGIERERIRWLGMPLHYAESPRVLSMTAEGKMLWRTGPCTKVQGRRPWILSENVLQIWHKGLKNNLSNLSKMYMDNQVQTFLCVLCFITHGELWWMLWENCRIVLQTMQTLI